jgi:hypothetical protein
LRDAGGGGSIWRSCSGLRRWSVSRFAAASMLDASSKFDTWLARMGNPRARMVVVAVAFPCVVEPVSVISAHVHLYLVFIVRLFMA